VKIMYRSDLFGIHFIEVVSENEESITVKEGTGTMVFKKPVSFLFNDIEDARLHRLNMLQSAEIDAIKRVRKIQGLRNEFQKELDQPIVFKRSFHAKDFPKGSRERAKLNLTPITSEYMSSYKWTVRSIDASRRFVYKSFRTEEEATTYATKDIEYVK